MKINLKNHLRNQVLIDYLPLVVFEARRMAERLPPMVDVDDLVSCGTIGLMDALRRFDPAREVKFRSFAVHRIRGAMLDFLRSNDTHSRPMREFARVLNHTIDVFTKERGRAPSFNELATLLKKTPEALSKKLSSLPAGPVLQLVNDDGEEVIPAEALITETGEEAFDTQQRRAALVEVINNNLNEREKSVLQLYYWEEISLREIAAIFGITDSRVSQILSQAKRKIFAKLKKNELFEGAA